MPNLIPADEQVASMLDELDGIQSKYYSIIGEMRIRYYHEIGTSLNDFISHYSGNRTVEDLLHICAVRLKIKGERNLWYAKRFVLKEPDIEQAIAKYSNWTEVKTRALKVELKPKQLPGNHTCEWETIQICTTCKKRKE